MNFNKTDFQNLAAAQILLNGCTFQQLIDAITLTLQTQNPATIYQPEPELITRDEVCVLLHINKTTLHKHTKFGRLKSYSIGNRVLYKRTEVLEAVTLLKK